MRIPPVAVQVASLLLLPAFVWAEDGCDASYDYVVVGSGPAGSVFARRAAECGHDVLILERGDYNQFGRFNDPPSTLNVGDYATNFFNTGDTRIPRMFPSAVPGFPGTEFLVGTTSANLGSSPNLMFQGKMIGGASSINGQMWTKPDLRKEIITRNGWPTLQGWDPLWLEKGFTMAEGVVNVERNDNPTIVSQILMGAAPFLGFSQQDVSTVGESFDSSLYPAAITRKDGKRHDAFSAYIDDAPQDVKDRITVFTGAEGTVQTILLDDYDDDLTGDSRKEAKGVLTALGVTYCGVKGVVMAAGAIWSPILLEASGIGPSSPLVANDQIGENLQDHLQHLRTFVLAPSAALTPIPFPFGYDYDQGRLTASAAQYEASQDGLFSDSFAKLIMFSKENGSSNHNFESHLIEGLLGVWPTPEEILTIGFALLALDISSRGSVHPVGPGQLQITADWGSSDDEIDAMISGLVRIRRLLAATLLPWQEIKGDQTPIPVQGVNPLTNQPWVDYRHSTTDFKGEILVGNPAAQNLPVLSAFHFVGSLSLGKVVNPQTLQVYGTHAVFEQNNPVPKFEEHEIRGLHVVDSSIIPKIPRTNTMGLTYAVAELASAKILKKEMSVMGDPHFHTWNERWFDFHGECDLVLVNSPQYADGLGLDIHIRTRIRGDYSFVSRSFVLYVSASLGFSPADVRRMELNEPWHVSVQMPMKSKDTDDSPALSYLVDIVFMDTMMARSLLPHG